MMQEYNFKISLNVGEEWNNYLLKSKYSTFFQTSEYFTSNSKDHFPIYIHVLDNDEKIVGQLTIRIINTTVLYSSPIFKKIAKIVSNITKRGIWVYGPIIHTDDKNSRLKILQQILIAVDKIAEQYDLVHIEGHTPPLDYLIDDDYTKLFEMNGYEKYDHITFVMDLSSTIDEIWSRVSKKTKGDVNRAQRRKIVTKTIESYDELKQYLLLNQEWARSKGLVITDPFKEIEKMWLNHKSGLEKFFLAYNDDKLISGVRVGCFNGIGYTNFVINSYSDSTNLGGTLLTWYILEWAKKSGMKLYDFSGGSKATSSVTNQEQNSLMFYKSKWGGKEVPYFGFVKPRKKLSYMLYRVMFNIVRKYHFFKMRV